MKKASVVLFVTLFFPSLVHAQVPVPAEDAPSCKQVCEHAWKIMMDSLPAEAAGTAAAMREDFDKECATECVGKMPPEMRRCVLQTQTVDGLEACEKNPSTLPQPAPGPEKPADVRPAPPALATGDAPSCEAVCNHAIPLLAAEMSVDQRTMLFPDGKVAPDLLAMCVKECDKELKPATRACSVLAQTAAELDECEKNPQSLAHRAGKQGNDKAIPTGMGVDKTPTGPAVDTQDPGCEKACAHAYDLLVKAPELPPDFPDRQSLIDNKGEFLKVCVEDCPTSLTPADRKCMMRAATYDALMNCDN